jgi:hypothetical protein
MAAQFGTFFEIELEMLLFMLKSFIIILIPSESLPRNLKSGFEFWGLKDIINRITR